MIVLILNRLREVVGLDEPRKIETWVRQEHAPCPPFVHLHEPSAFCATTATTSPALPPSDLQGSAQSPKARAAEPSKPEPSRAQAYGPGGLKVVLPRLGFGCKSSQVNLKLKPSHSSFSRAKLNGLAQLGAG